MSGRKIFSQEAAADEEMKEVMALLEAKKVDARPRGFASSTGPARAASPFTNPQSPVRSMLDIGPSVPRHASLPDTNGTGIAPTPIRSMLNVYSAPPAIRSMLDISTPLPSVLTTSVSKSAHASPTEAHHRAAMANSQHRSLSDASLRPADFGPRHIPGSVSGSGVTSQYQFSNYLQSNPGGPVIPKRNTQGGKKVVPSAIAEVVRGGDLSSLVSRDTGRHSIASTGIGIGSQGTKSKSPSNRLGLRTSSPHSSMLSPEPPRFVTKDGRVIDMNSAYRKLSDSNLAKSGGGLSSLSEKGRRRTSNGEAKVLEEGGIGRLEKDYTGEDEMEDSSDDDEGSSEDERNRGRKGKQSSSSDLGPESHILGMGRASGPRTARSLMAAAEEERAQVAEKYKVKSLLDPEIFVTTPGGSSSKSNKPVIRPHTAYDDEASGFNTPVDSDTEADLSDIKRAQDLKLRLTPISSTPATKRCVQTLLRGDFDWVHKEAKEHNRRLRKYIVATDLSEEAHHALQWTIGTVLRDGDTLLVIYCVDEEVGIHSTDGSADDHIIKGQVAAIANPMTSTPVLTTAAPAQSPLGHAFRLDNSRSSASPMSRERGKAEHERYKAVENITEQVSKLLRKTKLQVKIVIEVVHCKEPGHLIVEVVDFLNPTLVILGSRGRSALKSSVLGSFSNYMVTKSSVPVMVARKKLKKHTKYKRPDIRLTNNLSSPAIRSLASAKID